MVRNPPEAPASKAPRSPQKASSSEPGASWVDPDFKAIATVRYLEAAGKTRWLKATAAKLVDDEDGYINDAMMAALVSYPLGPAELAVIRSFPSRELASYNLIAPLWDGELDLFHVRDWSDLPRLTHLESFETDPDGHLPPLPLLARLPALRELRLGNVDFSKKAAQKQIESLGSLGFHLRSKQGSVGWVQMVRGPSVVATRLVASLDKLLPRLRSDQRRGGWRLGYNEMSVVTGDLVVTLDLSVFSPEHNLAHQETGERVLLSSRELPRSDADALLEERLKALFSAVDQGRRLPPA